MANDEYRATREKCSWCHGALGIAKPTVYIRMNNFGDWSNETGWSGEISCDRCGREIEYVGNKCEKKANVEKMLRELWRKANEVTNG